MNAGRIEPHELLDDVIVIRDDVEKATQNADQTFGNIVVDAACGSAILRGADIFAPGIIGAPVTLMKGDFVNVYADLEHKLLKGALKYDISGYLYIGQGKAHLGRSDLFKDNVQSGIAVTMTSTCSQCPRISDEVLSSVQDLYLMQNLPSILTVHQLDICANDKCLDMCAAPGGKTTHIAQMLGDQGSVIALDKSQSKIAQILRLAQRLGVQDKIQAFVQDATKATFDSESFEKILLDAPCSALGQRPMLVQNCQVKELQSFPKLQKKLFEKAVELLKPGGILVYSTCTTTLEENELLVHWAVEKFGNLELCPTMPIIGQPGYQNMEKVQRFGPSGDDDDQCCESTIGFFLAKFKKIS